jgi:hypothetical protein
MRDVEVGRGHIVAMIRIGQKKQAFCTRNFDEFAFAINTIGSNHSLHTKETVDTLGSMPPLDGSFMHKME